jgi:hypothetical protein
MKQMHLAVVQDPATYGNSIPRVDLEKSDPGVRRLLERQGIDMETFMSIPNQVKFVVELANQKKTTRNEARASVKNDLARLLVAGGIPAVELESETLAVHKQLLISKNSEQHWERKPHVHRGATQYDGTEPDGVWYNDGIVITRRDPTTLLVNTFSYWCGWTCVERIYEIDVGTWTVTRSAYNGFGHGLSHMQDGASAFQETVQSFTETWFPYTFKLEQGLGDGILYTIDTDAQGMCTFVGDDGTTYPYDAMCRV